MKERKIAGLSVIVKADYRLHFFFSYFFVSGIKKQRGKKEEGAVVLCDCI